MTPHEATIYAAIIASIGALLGGALGSIGTYFISKHVLINETKEHTRRELLNKEIEALQTFSVLVDFIDANQGFMNEEFTFSKQLSEIVFNCSSKIVSLPKPLRANARKLIKDIYQGYGNGVVNLEGSELANIRNSILTTLDNMKNLNG